MSLRISLSPSKRAAGRFINRVRRGLQKALAEEEKSKGLKQAEIARKIGVHRSVIHRQLNGYEDMTMGRVAELAWAMGRKAEISFPEASAAPAGSNIKVDPPRISAQAANLRKDDWKELPQAAE
jgi:transcriptional regulator with XRE-family HTH domain